MLLLWSTDKRHSLTKKTHDNQISQPKRSWFYSKSKSLSWPLLKKVDDNESEHIRQHSYLWCLQFNYKEKKLHLTIKIIKTFPWKRKIVNAIGESRINFLPEKSFRIEQRLLQYRSESNIEGFQNDCHSQVTRSHRRDIVKTAIETLKRNFRKKTALQKSTPKAKLKNHQLTPCRRIVIITPKNWIQNL